MKVEKSYNLFDYIIHFLFELCEKVEFLIKSTLKTQHVLSDCGSNYEFGK